MGHCVTKKVQALLLATFHSMKAVDLPLVIEGHEPICTPTGAACEGRVLSGMWELAGAGMAMSARKFSQKMGWRG